MGRRFSVLLRAEVVRNALKLVGGTSLGQLVMLAAMPLLTRIYTPQDFGVFAIYTSIAAVLSVVATLRYDVAIVLPESEREARLLTMSTIVIAFAISAPATLALLLLGPLLSEALGVPELAPWLALAGVGGFTLAMISILSFWLNRRRRYGDISIGRVTMMTGTAGAQLAFGATPIGVGGLIAGAITGQAASVVWLAARAGRGILGPREERVRMSRRSFAEARELLGRYWRMPLLNGPTAIIDALRISAVNIVIGFISLTALGFFSIAWKLLEIPSFLLGNAVSQVVLQRLASSDAPARWRFLRRTVIVCAGVGIIPFGAIFVLAPWVVPWFLGPQWVPAVGYAQALVPWIYVSFIAVGTAPIFVVTDRQHVPLLISIVYLVTALALFLALRDDLLLATAVVSVVTAGILSVQIGWGLASARADARAVR